MKSCQNKNNVSLYSTLWLIWPTLTDNYDCRISHHQQSSLHESRCVQCIQRTRVLMPEHSVWLSRQRALMQIKRPERLQDVPADPSELFMCMCVCMHRPEWLFECVHAKKLQPDSYKYIKYNIYIIFIFASFILHKLDLRFSQIGSSVVSSLKLVLK